MIGRSLLPALKREGHRPVAVVRRPAKGADEIMWRPAEGELDAESLAGMGAVIHLAGAGIGDKRWTPERKKFIVESRTSGTGLLGRTLAEMDRPPATLLSSSAIGFYPFGTTPLDETAGRGSGFLSDVCVAWEGAAAAAVEADNVRVVFMRTGIVQDRSGGALGRQLLLFKLGLGGRMGSGRQMVSWITIDDQIGAMLWLLKNHDVSGPVNLTAPNPVTNSVYTKALGAAVNRPTLIPIPSFGPKLLVGSEAAENMIFKGQNIIPQVLLDNGYPFIHTDVEVGLKALVSRKQERA